jgi:hypothetical protein
MALQIQFRSGTTAQHNTFTGAEGEVTVDTTKDVIVVHDGVTAGGFPVASRANADGTIGLIKKDGTSAGIINSGGLFNNTLTSTNVDQALTAAQGKVLKDAVDTKQDISSSFGAGQTWQNMTSTRASATTYTNSASKPIQLYIITGTESYSFTVGSANMASAGDSMVQVTVPSGSTYSFTGTIVAWWELR